MRTYGGPAGAGGGGAGAGARSAGGGGGGGGGNDLVLGVAANRLCVVSLVHMASLWVDGEGLAGAEQGAGPDHLYRVNNLHPVAYWIILSTEKLDDLTIFVVKCIV